MIVGKLRDGVSAISGAIRYPDVYVIGAMRAGTTQFYNMLSGHSDISLPQMKELDLFVSDDSLIKYTPGFFARQFNANSRILMDVSPNYTMKQTFSGVARRIQQANPKAKFIFLARCPVRRAQSQLAYAVASENKSLDIQDYSNQSGWHDILESSRYASQLAEYLECFDRERFYFIEFEKFIRSPSSCNSGLSGFLGVPVDFPESSPPKANSTADLESTPKWWFRFRSSPLGEHLRSMASRDMISRMKRVVQSAPGKRGLVPQLSDEDIDRMSEFLAADAQSFRKLSGLKGEDWLV